MLSSSPYDLQQYKERKVFILLSVPSAMRRKAAHWQLVTIFG
jgi:hypothetical protein